MSELLTSSASFKERTAFFSDKFITEQPVDKAGRNERTNLSIETSSEFKVKTMPNGS